MGATAQPKLTFTLLHSGPIPLGDFTGSLARVASRYARFARGRGEADEVKLYISEIRHGSTIVDIINNILPVVAPILPQIPTIVEFGKGLVGMLAHFKEGGVKASEVSIADCDDVRLMMKPVLHAEGGGLNIAVSGDQNLIQPIFLSVGQADAMAMDNRAALLRDALGARAEDLLSKVLFQWDQIKKTPGVEDGLRTPDRGIIGSVDQTPRKVLFAEASLKDRMYLAEFNPWSVGFLVDAKLLIGSNGKPEAYLIQAVYEHFDLSA